MTSALYTPSFAQAYGSGTFGGCDYSSTTCSTTSAASGNGSLVNTGIAVAGIVTLACLIILVAIVVRVWRRKPARQDEPAASEQDSAERLDRE